MPVGDAPEAPDCFAPARRVVPLLEHAAFTRSGSWMGRPIDRAMHRAITAHGRDVPAAPDQRVRCLR